MRNRGLGAFPTKLNTLHHEQRSSIPREQTSIQFSCRFAFKTTPKYLFSTPRSERARVHTIRRTAVNTSKSALAWSCFNQPQIQHCQILKTSLNTPSGRRYCDAGRPACSKSCTWRYPRGSPRIRLLMQLDHHDFQHFAEVEYRPYSFAHARLAQSSSWFRRYLEGQIASHLELRQ